VGDDRNAEALAANYAGAFDGRLALGRRPALVVIDIARAYTDPGSPLYAGDGMPGVVASTARLVADAHVRGIPVYWTEVRFQAGGADGGVFYRKVPALACFDEGNPLGELAEGLEVGPGDVRVVKQYASSFFGTSLAASLTARGVDSLVIAGVSTSGCVRATAVDAVQHGFIPVVVRDAVGDRHPGPHEANLFDIQAKYGEVLAEAEVLTWWASLPGGPPAPPGSPRAGQG
jgi:nicotinamidase-related amidase